MAGDPIFSQPILAARPIFLLCPTSAHSHGWSLNTQLVCFWGKNSKGMDQSDQRIINWKLPRPSFTHYHHHHHQFVYWKDPNERSKNYKTSTTMINENGCIFSNHHHHHHCHHHHQVLYYNPSTMIVIYFVHHPQSSSSISIYHPSASSFLSLITFHHYKVSMDDYG